MHPVLDRPAETSRESRAATCQRRPEHSHAVELAPGRKRTNNPGARGAVSKVVSVRTRISDESVTSLVKRNVATNLPADGWVIRVNTAVNDGYLDACTG
jgi:hypothetical protein